MWWFAVLWIGHIKNYEDVHVDVEYIIPEKDCRSQVVANNFLSAALTSRQESKKSVLCRTSNQQHCSINQQPATTVNHHQPPSTITHQQLATTDTRTLPATSKSTSNHQPQPPRPPANSNRVRKRDIPPRQVPVQVLIKIILATFGYCNVNFCIHFDNLSFHLVGSVAFQQ